MPWLFLIAYWCSGFAGLIYEVCWTRLLTLYLGHTTAAASAVVAAFLGGLAAGAAIGGLIASRLSARHALNFYIALELVVAIAAVALPYEARTLTPVLRWAYVNGEPGVVFPIVRLLSCLLMVFVPAAALGATFPMAIRWFADDSDSPARRTGVLYAVNTTGAAVGALLAGFVLIPALGLSATTDVGVAASALAASCVLALVLSGRSQPSQLTTGAVTSPRPSVSNQKCVAKFSGARRPHGKARGVRISGIFARRATQPGGMPRPENGDAFLIRDTRQSRTRRSAKREAAVALPPMAPVWLPPVILALSGFAALVHEIVWTRMLSLILGPTIFAFAATIAAVIAGVAAGSALGTWVASRSNNRALWLMTALAGAALSNSWTQSLAGGNVPHLVAHYMATSSIAFDQLLRQGTLLTAALIVPTAICFGAAFPLALATIRTSSRAASQFGIVYAVNTLGAVAGSLLCGFAFIPLLGLHATFSIVSGCLIAATLAIVVSGRLTTTARATGVVAASLAGLMVVLGPPWDRALLASGAYLYAPYVPKDLDLDRQLKAGTLLYDRDGAAATVSVKRLTGTLTLAVDGKVDASNRGDMLTQKLLAHLPLLLHDNPRDVVVIGLGSGVTVGAALRHPIARVDVVEISPEVVEASRVFAVDNQHALDDPRAHLILGDGRSHLLLSTRRYDVIISEPSNPWIAGVAALFTREFFQAARARLAPGGIICQWAHTYNITDADLRAIVATFTSVFPNGTLWLIGGDDVLLVASGDDGDRIDARLANIDRHWQRPGVAADLASVAASEPFSVSSLFAGGPRELAGYTAGASILTDDRMALEFSGPRALHASSAEGNGATLGALTNAAPAAVEQDGSRVVRSPVQLEDSTSAAVHWQRRGAMMFKADAYASAYRDYLRALTLDFANPPALDGFVRSAVLAGRATEAITWIRGETSTKPVKAAQLVAISRLLASSGLGADALDTAKQAVRLFPSEPAALEQLASVVADAGDSAQLDETVARMQALAPARASTLYFSAVSALIHGRADETVRLSERSITADPTYAPVYDLVGAAYTKLDRTTDARQAFETSLRLDAHDSTAYTNLGLLELAAGNRQAAANDFAEALGLAPNSETAREGLARSR